MKKVHRQQKFENLRKEYPVFTFEKYSYSVYNNVLSVEFVFNLSDKYFFRPRLSIPSRLFFDFKNLNRETINNFVFNIGMVELISYWKAASPPTLHIACHSLDDAQIKWWKKLYYNGLGEFFYLNDIATGKDDFMHISTSGTFLEPVSTPLNENKIIVPIGGGKDSAVTLELLKQAQNREIIPFVLNPREASVRTIETAGFTMAKAMVVNRQLDTQLLVLNKNGFLNGHTPFSALLAFVSAFLATLVGAKYVALSNESSANESTVPGSHINHQYSKSFEFETDFSRYLKKYVQSNVHYFSFLRPLNELQIASIFAKLKQHHAGFRSCNVGSKTDSWCGTCPKCLFTAIILSPFLPEQEIEAIFHKKMFGDTSLHPLFDELTGKAAVKPFECVGTPSEVNVALQESFATKAVMPELLKDFSFDKKQNTDFQHLLQAFNPEHRVPDAFLTLLKKNLYA